MASPLETLRARMAELHDQMEKDLAEKREAFRYRIERGRATFEADMRRHHRNMRISTREFLRATRPLVVLTAPVIYALIIPLVLLDLFVTVYQAICFPIYGIARVKRADHIVIDRHLLGYLNWLQKLNCVYCGYGNGLLSYAREIAGRTEQYWCPIKHARRVADPHGHYADFTDFGDAEGFREGLDPLRDKLRACSDVKASLEAGKGCENCACGKENDQGGR